MVVRTKQVQQGLICNLKSFPTGFSISNSPLIWVVAPFTVSFNMILAPVVVYPSVNKEPFKSDWPNE